MADNIDRIIDAVLEAEGGSKFTDTPQDAGGRTQYGIAERSNPEAWRDGKVTEEEARAIYRRKYVEKPGFDKIIDKHLQHLLVDWGVNSGPAVAIKHLQRLVGVKDDGVLGPKSLKEVNWANPRTLANRLVVERIKMIGRIVNNNPSQAKFLNGWINRCVEFFIY